MKKTFTKKIAAAFIAAAIALTFALPAFANDGMGIDTMNVTTEDWADTVMVVNNQAGANVRTAPTTAENGRILFNLANGTRIIVNGKTSNGWYRIITVDPVYGGECCGYISGNLLSFENTAQYIAPAGPATGYTTPPAVANGPASTHVIINGTPYMY